MAPRSAAERKADTLRLLADEKDAWVATGDRAGHGYLVPLSIWWDGERITMATDSGSRTARSLADGGSLRLSIGGTRDVVMIDGTTEIHPVGDDVGVAEAFAERHSWDPRGESGEWVFIRVRPTRIQAWREADEIEGRTIMRGGAWLV